MADGARSARWLLAVGLALAVLSLAMQVSGTGRAGQDSKAYLNGSWELYWGALLSPEELEGAPAEAGSIHVPSSWRGQPLNGAFLPKYGHATYRLTMPEAVEEIGKLKALYLRYVGSAYRIWVNGKEHGGVGQVGRSAEEEFPRLQMNLILFELEEDEVEIVVQVSNYSFREGGIFGEVVYGDVQTVIHSLLKTFLSDIFLIGGFVIIGLYHLIIYMTRRNERSNLWIALGAMAIALRTLLLNEYLVFLLFPVEDWSTLVKAEYLSELAGFIMIIMLLRHLYPQEVHRGMLYTAYAVTALFSVYIVAAPVRIFTETMLVHVAILAGVLAYFVFYVGIMAVVRKREGAGINMLAVFCIVAGAVNDALYYVQLAHTVPVLEYSVLLFLLLQGVIVSYRYGLLFNKNRKLAAELVHANATLEHKVEERTKELHEMNAELAQTHDMRTKAITNIAHDLGSPLQGIQTYLKLMVQGQFDTNNRELVKRLHERSMDMKRLIDDLFELSKLESGEMWFHLEWAEANSFIRAVHEKLALDLRGGQLELGRLNTAIGGREARIRIDRNQIVRVLQNYIGNAEKFSRPQEGPIVLNSYIRECQSAAGLPAYELCVEVADQGEGIEQEQLAYVFNRLYTSRESHAGGSGLGLAICKEIISKHGGQVGAASEVGRGSVFSFTLPAFANNEWLRDDS